jgi:peptidoglycan/xylan/chitin deacetylase (PgdA/CDA1 family)
MGRKAPAGSFRTILFHDLPEAQLAAFDRLVQHVMATHGFITPAEAESILAGSPDPTNLGIRVLLTFDDGFQSQARAAREILDRYAIKALFFLCPGLMDVPAERQKEAIARCIFDGEGETSLPGPMRLLSWSEAKSLLASGHTIGSHTAFHRRLCGLGVEELRSEIVGSGELLEKRLGISVRWFAYPFGNIESIDPSSYELIRSRYEFSCSGIRGLNSSRTHPLALLRDCMDPTSPLEYQEFILLGGVDFFYRKRARRLHVMAESPDKIQ